MMEKSYISNTSSSCSLDGGANQTYDRERNYVSSELRSDENATIKDNPSNEVSSKEETPSALVSSTHIERMRQAPIRVRGDSHLSIHSLYINSELGDPTK